MKRTRAIDTAFCDGWAEGFIAAFALKLGMRDQFDRRADEMLARKPVMADPHPDAERAA